MPLNKRGLAQIAGASTAGRAPQIHSYSSEDAAAAIVADAAYFGEYAGLFHPGDLMIIVTTDSAGLPLSAGLHMVKEVGQATVTLSAASGLTV